MGSHSHVYHLSSHTYRHFSECGVCVYVCGGVGVCVGGCVCVCVAPIACSCYTSTSSRKNRDKTCPILQEPPAQKQTHEHIGTVEHLIICGRCPIEYSIAWGRDGYVKKEPTEDKRFKLDLETLVTGGHMDKLFRRYLRKRKCHLQSKKDLRSILT